MGGPNGVIEIDNRTTVMPTWLYTCEWIVEVKPGRTVEVKVVRMSMQQRSNSTCTDNYLMVSFHMTDYIKKIFV